MDPLKVVEVEEEEAMNMAEVEEAMNMAGVEGVMNMVEVGVAMSMAEVEVAMNKAVVGVEDVEATIKVVTEVVEETKFKEAGQMVAAVILVDTIKIVAIEILDFKVVATKVVVDTRVVAIKETVVVTKVQVVTKEEDMVATKDHPTLEADFRVEAINKTTDIKMLTIKMTEGVAVEVAEEGGDPAVEEEDMVVVGVLVEHRAITKGVNLNSTFNMEAINIISLVLDKEGTTQVELIPAINTVELR